MGLYQNKKLQNYRKIKISIINKSKKLNKNYKIIHKKNN